MTRPDLSRRYGCPDCGGMVSWWTPECPHCRNPISLSARLDWIEEPARTILIAAAVVVGALLGLAFCYIPKPDSLTAISATIFIWYAQRVTSGKLASCLTCIPEPSV